MLIIETVLNLKGGVEIKIFKVAEHKIKYFLYLHGGDLAGCL